MIIDLKGGKIMENQSEIIEVVEQGSKKGKLGKLALVATGIAASVGAILLLRKKKRQQGHPYCRLFYCLLKKSIIIEKQ